MYESYTIPESYQGSPAPGSGGKDNLWITFVAKEFLSQSAYARGDGSIKTGEILASFMLLAPNEIAENVAHEWGEYESLATRITQKIGDVKKAVADIKGLKNETKTAYENVKSWASGEAVEARSLMSRVAGAATGASVPKYKLDNPLVYQNSQRREYSLTFHFAFIYGDKSAEDSVFKPIRKLEELSCPELDEGLINIKFPALFRVYSTPGDIIKINHAVLTAVQPTGSAPYNKGYPISCELQLTFQDIEPLYRKSFSQGGIVKVRRSG